MRDFSDDLLAEAQEAMRHSAGMPRGQMVAFSAEACAEVLALIRWARAGRTAGSVCRSAAMPERAPKSGRLGIQQLELLCRLGPQFILLVPSKVSRSLVARGLMVAEPSGSCARVTPAGLRALADAAEAGRISLAPPPPYGADGAKQPKRKGKR